MVPGDFIDLNASTCSGSGNEDNELGNLKCDPRELEPQPSDSRDKANSIDDEKPAEGNDGGVIEDLHVQEMELEEDDEPLILPKSIKLDEIVIASEKIDKDNSFMNCENGAAAAQNESEINDHTVHNKPISGIKRARIAYDDKEPSVRVIYNSLTSASKKKLSELLQQWSEWNTQHDSSIEKPQEALVSGEETYFPALLVGLKRSSTVSFWMDNETRKEQTKEIIQFDGESAPRYDREYTLGLTSAEGSTNVERGLEIEASRCFNCASYNHALKECPKPRDHVAVNNARKQHNSKKPQNAGPQKQTRYYQNSSGGKYEGLKPGFLGPETRQILGIGEFDPPPWLHRMREIGYPPGYLDVDNDATTSGIKIYTDDETTNKKTKEDQEDGELSETEEPEPEPEPKKRMSVEFPGINAPIPENADEKQWASSRGTSNFDPYRLRFNPNSNRSSDTINREHYSDNRRSRTYKDDAPPGCDTPSYSGSGTQSSRNPSLGRYVSNRSRTNHEGSPHQSPYNTLPYSNSDDRYSPKKYSSDIYETRDYNRNPSTNSESSSKNERHSYHHRHTRR